MYFDFSSLVHRDALASPLGSCHVVYLYIQSISLKTVYGASRICLRVNDLFPPRLLHPALQHLPMTTTTLTNVYSGLNASMHVSYGKRPCYALCTTDKERTGWLVYIEVNRGDLFSALNFIFIYSCAFLSWHPETLKLSSYPDFRISPKKTFASGGFCSFRSLISTRQHNYFSRSFFSQPTDTRTCLLFVWPPRSTAPAMLPAGTNFMLKQLHLSTVMNTDWGLLWGRLVGVRFFVH